MTATATSSVGERPRTTPLNRPVYRTDPGTAIARFFRKYVTFSGRASRAEYWWAALFTAVVPVAIRVVEVTLAGAWGTPQVASRPDVFVGLFALVTFLPTLAVTWRRLHDTNRSGLWILLNFLPVVGSIWLLVLLVSRPNAAGARFDQY